MEMEKEIARINKLTFGQLRNELANCTDPVRQYIIRNLMYVRYTQYLEHKETQNQMKKDYKKNQISKIKKKIISKRKQKDKDKDKPLELFDLDELTNLDNLDELDNLNNLDNLTQDQIKEYNKDKTNRNIMNRLYNDIDINKMKDSKKKLDNEFVPPFSTGSDDQYASFDTAFKTTN